MAPVCLQHWHKSSEQRNSSHSKTIDGWSGEGGSCLCTTGGTTCIVTRTIRDVQPMAIENVSGCKILLNTLVAPSGRISSASIQMYSRFENYSHADMKKFLHMPNEQTYSAVENLYE